MNALLLPVLFASQPGPAPDPAVDANVSASADDAPIEVDPQLVQFFAEGNRLFKAQASAGAIAAFTDGLRLSIELGDDVMVAYFRVNLGHAHLQAHEEDGDVSHLNAARSHFRRGLQGAEDLDTHDRDEITRSSTEGLDEANRVLAEIEAAEKRRAEQLMSASSPPLGPTAPQPSAESHRDLHRRRTALGVTMVGAGGVALIGGIAGLAYGLRARDLAREQLGDNPAPNQVTYVDEEVPRIQRVWYGLGGAGIALGVTGVAAGAVLLIRRPHVASERAAVRVAPLLARKRAGLGLIATF